MSNLAFSAVRTQPNSIQERHLAELRQFNEPIKPTQKKFVQKKKDDKGRTLIYTYYLTKTQLEQKLIEEDKYDFGFNLDKEWSAGDSISDKDIYQEVFYSFFTTFRGQTEPEFQKALADIQAKERKRIAELWKQLKK